MYRMSRICQSGDKGPRILGRMLCWGCSSPVTREMARDQRGQWLRRAALSASNHLLKRCVTVCCVHFTPITKNTLTRFCLLSSKALKRTREKGLDFREANPAKEKFRFMSQ